MFVKGIPRKLYPKAESFAKRVKCQVSRVMAFRAKAEFVPIACADRGFAMVRVPVVSGTAVAPTESCELSRFEIPLTLKEQT